MLPTLVPGAAPRLVPRKNAAPPLARPAEAIVIDALPATSGVAPIVVTPRSNVTAPTRSPEPAGLPLSSSPEPVNVIAVLSPIRSARFRLVVPSSSVIVPLAAIVGVPVMEPLPLIRSEPAAMKVVPVKLLDPVRFSAPDPVLVNGPAPVNALENVELPVAVVSIVPAPVKLNCRALAQALPTRIAPPSNVIAPDASPNARSPDAVRRIPALIVVPPVYVFVPEMVTVPGPVLCMPALPVSVAESNWPFVSWFQPLLLGELCRISAAPVSVIVLVVFPAGSRRLYVKGVS